MAKMKYSFAWSPIRRLMKQQGSSIVAKNSVDLLIDHLEKTATSLTDVAKSFAMHSNRKKVSVDDLLLAARSM